jgi:catechol 2,3-dioxygenase-like lactoylglutathione lyase family enzyme
LLTGLGYQRWRNTEPEWQEPSPTRAAWSIRYPDGSSFGIDLRPAREASRRRRYDRYRPGPHHLAFQVESDAAVDTIHGIMQETGAEILDPPSDYGGRAGYGAQYYAVFFADPDGFKIEVVHAPGFAG